MMKSTIKIEAYPIIYKVIVDAEMKLTDLTGMRVKLEMVVKDKHVLTKDEVDKIRLQVLVCSEFAMTWKNIVDRNRKQNIVDARKVYCYLATKVLGLTTVETGKDLHRDHTSVMHLRDACADLVEVNDYRITRIVERIKSNLYDEEI